MTVNSRGKESCFKVPEMASRWKFWAARIFGKKSIATDSGCTVTLYHWRGVSYLVEVSYE